MPLPRRDFLRLTLAAAAVPAFPRLASAQTYPSRPVRVVVPTASGGPADILARMAGQWLSERFGYQIVVENRPGAGSNLGTEAVVRSAPDGHTLLLVTTSAAINATLYEKLNFNFLRDIAPISGIARVPSVMFISSSLPVTNASEFIAYARARPGKITMGSSGIGGAAHMAGELLQMLTGIDLVHVPYRGVVPALTDLLAGQVQVAFINPGVALEYVKTGKLRALGITTATRSDALPNVPALSESVPGYEATLVYGLGAPRGTPNEIIEKLNREISASFADRKTKERFADLDGEALAGTPADLGRLIAEETEKWGKVIRTANIKPV